MPQMHSPGVSAPQTFSPNVSAPQMFSPDENDFSASSSLVASCSG